MASKKEENINSIIEDFLQAEKEGIDKEHLIDHITSQLPKKPIATARLTIERHIENLLEARGFIEEQDNKIILTALLDQDSTKISKEIKCVAIDFETRVRYSSAHPDGECFPFQMAAVKFGLDKKWSSEKDLNIFVKFPEHVKEELTPLLKKNLIDKQEREGLDTVEAWSQFYEYIKDADYVVAHGGTSLDFPLMQSNLPEKELPPLIDSRYLALATWPTQTNQSLSGLIERYVLPGEAVEPHQWHDALYDSRSLVRLVEEAVQQLIRGRRDLLLIISPILEVSTTWQMVFKLSGENWPREEVTISKLQERVKHELVACGKKSLRAESNTTKELRPPPEFGEKKASLENILKIAKGEDAQPRDSQQTMTDKLKDRNVTVGLIEAPTGTGKSYAVLTASIEWLLASSENRVLISTYTKQLQSQLAQDVETLGRKIINLSETTAITKGSSNRLSLKGLLSIFIELYKSMNSEPTKKLPKFYTEPLFIELLVFLLMRFTSKGETPIAEWQSYSVDPADCPFFFESYIGSAWHQYLSHASQRETREYIGNKDILRSYVSSVKEALDHHRLNIVNHALLIEHIKDLPDTDKTLLIIDEAHSLEEAVTSSLSDAVSYEALRKVVKGASSLSPHLNFTNSDDALRFKDDIKNIENVISNTFRSALEDVMFLAGKRHKRSDRTLSIVTAFDEMGSLQERLLREISSVRGRLASLNHSFQETSLKITGKHEADYYEHLKYKMGDISWQLTKIWLTSKTLKGDSLELQQWRERNPRAEEITNEINPGNRVVWVKETLLNNYKNHSDGDTVNFILSSSPIDIAKQKDYQVFLGLFSQLFLVSATLKIGGEWSYILNRLGIDNADCTLALDSPFDFSRQAKLVCLEDFPSWTEHEEIAIKTIVQQLSFYLGNRPKKDREVNERTKTKHGAMLLTTSTSVAEALAQSFIDRANRDLTVFSAPYMGAPNAVKSFKEKGGLLVGTKGLWQGVDIEEPDLVNILWINKIPFHPLGDPIFTARQRAIIIREEDKNNPKAEEVALEEFYLPSAAMELKQGIGRLIRSQDHRGVAVISDRRLCQNNRTGQLYRRVLLGSLDVGWIKDIASIKDNNIYGMEEGWKEIWRFLGDNGIVSQERLGELTSSESIHEQVWPESIRRIKNLASSGSEWQSLSLQNKIERCKEVRNVLFGDDSEWRPGQLEAITYILENKNVLAVLATSAGKSAIFQVPALVSPGITLVISPLVSLMTDQAMGLNKSIGGMVRALTSPMRESNSRAGKMAVFNELSGKDQNIKIVYFSPERLSESYFQDRVKEAVKTGVVSHIVIDEAHTFATWGEDFRPSFKRAKRFLKRLSSERPGLHFTALTATATPAIKKVLVEMLGNNPKEVASGSSIRDNLSIYGRLHGSSKANTETLISSVKKALELGHLIVYTVTIKEAIKIRNYLLKYLGEGHKEQILLYHGRMSDFQKEKVANKFKTHPKMEAGGSPMVVVATNAFGLGVDRPDVRTVIVAQLPHDPAALYQQLGRAGRDQKYSFGIITTAINKDIKLGEFMSKKNAENRSSLYLNKMIEQLLLDRNTDTPFIDIEKEVEKFIKLTLPETTARDDLEQRRSNARTLLIRTISDLDLKGYIEDLGDIPSNVTISIEDGEELDRQIKDRVTKWENGLPKDTDLSNVNMANLSIPKQLLNLDTDNMTEKANPQEAWILLKELYRAGYLDIKQKLSGNMIAYKIKSNPSDLDAALKDLKSIVKPESGLSDIKQLMEDVFSYKQKCFSVWLSSYFNENQKTCNELSPCFQCLTSDIKKFTFLPPHFAEVFYALEEPEQIDIDDQSLERDIIKLLKRHKRLGTTKIEMTLSGQESRFINGAPVSLDEYLCNSPLFGTYPELQDGENKEKIKNTLAGMTKRRLLSKEAFRSGYVFKIGDK